MVEDPLLNQVKELVQQGQYDDALPLVKALLAKDRKNAEYWYWAAMVTPDLTRKRTALDNVLNLDPLHAQAQAALDKLNGVQPLTRAVRYSRESVIESTQGQGIKGCLYRLSYAIFMLFAVLILVMGSLAGYSAMNNMNDLGAIRSAAIAIMFFVIFGILTYIRTNEKL